MKKLSLTICAMMAMALPMSFASALPAQAAGQCLSNQEIQAALSSGEIGPVAAALAQAGVGRDAKVLSVRVCKEGGRMVYVVAVLSSNGDARNLTLPAGN
ncbi:MAG TPA: hypothetical protein VGO70_06500 [Arsenicitalea sp.]|jgi:hypothetical protein|nr:hypothetical protein [Arsenicitalea sp.]